MYGFYPLASGSKGNSIFLRTPQGKFLIDAGLSAKALKERLAVLDVDIAEIDAILVTHEHIDHIRAIHILGCRMGIPIFTNSDTAKAIYALIHETPKFKIFSTGESFEFADVEIHPFSIQHDAIDPVAFTIKVEGLKLGFCTDLGFATTLVAAQLQNCDYLYLESNHEVSMVHASSRPMIYKQRVLSRQGHLSNEQCACLLKEIYHEKLKHVHLAHLSSECNAPEAALRSAALALNDKVTIAIAEQSTLSPPVLF